MAREALVVGDEQIAGRGAHEDLDAGSAGQPLQLGDVVGVVVRAADEEGEVAMHAAAWRGATLSASASAVTVSGLVLGISKTAVTPPMTAASEPDSEILLVLGAGLAEMDLGVDDAGQDVQAGAVDDLAGARRGRARRSRRCGRRGRRCRARRRRRG